MENINWSLSNKFMIWHHQADDPAEEEEYDDLGASPEHPGRSRFNMTNIVEESRSVFSPGVFMVPEFSGFQIEFDVFSHPQVRGVKTGSQWCAGGGRWRWGEKPSFANASRRTRQSNSYPGEIASAHGMNPSSLFLSMKVTILIGASVSMSTLPTRAGHTFTLQTLSWTRNHPSQPNPSSTHCHCLTIKQQSAGSENLSQASTAACSTSFSNPTFNLTAKHTSCSPFSSRRCLYLTCSFPIHPW